MHALGWCTLHGLLKDKTKTEVRPLGVGEYFRRLIASTLLRARRSDFLRYFFGAAAAAADTNRKPYQFAVGVKAGADMLVHAVRLLLETHPELVAIKLDATNAFNSVNRQPLMNELKTHFPGLAPFFERMCLDFPPRR